MREVAPSLTRFIGSRFGHDLADDVVAETFLVVWRRRDDLPRDDPALRAWVRECARRTALDAQARASRRRVRDLRDAATSAPRGEVGPEDEVIASVETGRLLALLGPAEAEVVRLTIIDGMNATEAGAVLGVEPATVRQRVARARAKMRAHLHPTDETRGERRDD